MLTILWRWSPPWGPIFKWRRRGSLSNCLCPPANASWVTVVSRGRGLVLIIPSKLRFRSFWRRTVRRRRFTVKGLRQQCRLKLNCPGCRRGRREVSILVVRRLFRITSPIHLIVRAFVNV